jgi:hypothetical protein
MNRELANILVEEVLNEFIDNFAVGEEVETMETETFNKLLTRIKDSGQISETFFYTGKIFGILIGTEMDRYELDNNKISTFIDLMDGSIG